MTRPLDMRHSRRALAEYDRTAAEHEARFAAANTSKEVLAWVAADDVRNDALREAFFLDTADRNSWNACQEVSIDFVRRMVESTP